MGGSHLATFGPFGGTQPLREGTSSGGAVINDTLIHFYQLNLPFGGVGQSGIGKAHGRFGFEAFSPFTVRSVIAAAAAIKFEEVLAGDQQRLSTLKQDVVRAGVRAVTGIDMPTHEKRRFQDGLTASPRTRVTKAWCRRVFERDWAERLRAAEEGVRRSGNEMQVGS